MNNRLSNRNILITLMISYIGGFVISYLTVHFSTKQTQTWLVLGFIVGLAIVIAAALAISEPEMGHDAWMAYIFLDPDTGKMLHVGHDFGRPKDLKVFINNWYYYTSYPYKDTPIIGAIKPSESLPNPRELTDSVVHLSEMGIYGALTGVFMGDDPPLFADMLQQSSRKGSGIDDGTIVKAPLKSDTYTITGRYGQFSKRYRLKALPREQVDANLFLRIIKDADLSNQFIYGEMICFPVPRKTKLKYKHFWLETPNRMASQLIFTNHFVSICIAIFGIPAYGFIENTDSFGLEKAARGSCATRLETRIEIGYRAKLLGSIFRQKKARLNVAWARYIVELIKKTTSYDYHLSAWEPDTRRPNLESDSLEEKGQPCSLLGKLIREIINAFGFAK